MDSPNVEKTQENIIIYDWLSFSTKIHSIADLKEYMGIEKLPFQEIYGFYGYNKRLTYEGISILYDGCQPDMGILVEMSGQGCRTFESEGNGNYENIFDMIKYEKKDMNITRLDVAFDDHTGIFNMKRLKKDAEAKNFVSKTRSGETINDLDTGGITVTHGKKCSDIFIRIYDKAKERGFTDGRHWARFEVMLRDGNAFGFISNEKPIGEKFRGVVYNYLRYVIPDKSNKNKSRWKNTKYWDKFIEAAEKIKIYQKPGTEYNEENLERFVLRNSGNSINAFRKIYGDKNLLKALDLQPKTYSLKQKALIEKYAGKRKKIPYLVLQAKKSREKHEKDKEMFREFVKELEE